MVKMIFKLFVRSFRKNFFVNFLNLMGLAAGLAACMMIIFYLNYEYSYDDYHAHGDRIVRVTTFQKVGEGQELRLPTASYAVAEGLAEQIGAVENYVRFWFEGTSNLFYVGDKPFSEDYIAWADSTLFDIFSFKLLQGDPRTALAGAGKAVLSASTARKFFGNQNPIGQEFESATGNSYTVTGVMEDIQQPSHLQSFPIILSFREESIPFAESWVGRSAFGSYLLLAKGHTAADVQPIAERVYYENAKETLKALSADCRITLQPLSEIHFDDSFDFKMSYQPPVAFQSIIIFAAVAIFILIIASVNFINMATARSAERAHQVGISKAVGASRRLLVLQFLGEFLLMALLALAIGMLFIELLLPMFGGFVGREFTFSYREDWGLLFVFIALAAIVGVGAGLYPAFVLSSFRPASTIRERYLAGTSRSRLRQTLIGFQFTVAITLIICTLAIRHQISFMQERDPGFDYEGIMTVKLINGWLLEDGDIIREEALRHPSILSVTSALSAPLVSFMEYTFRVPGEADCEMLMTRLFITDPWFLETMGIKLVEGRDFNKESAADLNTTLIINRAAARQLGWDDPVGKQLDASPTSESFDPITIIGVIEDINYESYHKKIYPMAIWWSDYDDPMIAFRLKEGETEAAIAHIRSIWDDKYPDSPFSYRFLDDRFYEMYEYEIRLERLFAFYTTLAIVISCVGVLALIAFSAERRVREIGIRKVLGATPRSLFALLSKEYVRVVFIAFFIASFVSWYIMQRWLENFEYRAPFAWWLFPASAAIALAVALLTAGVYTWRACMTSPADVLRQE